MICQYSGCGAVFCWDYDNESTLGGARKDYCSATCKHRAKERRVAIAACAASGTPGYATEADAAEAMAEMRGRTGSPPFYTRYRKCLHWHIYQYAPPPEHGGHGHRPARTIGRQVSRAAARASTPDVDWAAR